MEFIKAIHPMLESNGLSIANTISREITSGKVDVKKATINIGKKRLKERDLKKRLIVIDDLERSKLSPNEILGYISPLVIEEGIRVIIIANEDEYIKSDSSRKEEYEIIRENLIAYRFEVQNDVDNAIKAFLNEVRLPQDKFFEITKEVVNNLDINNLRVVRQALINYSHLESKISKSMLQENQIYFEEIFKVNLALFTQFAQGEINQDKKMNIENAAHCYYKYNKSLKKFYVEKGSDEEGFLELVHFGRIALSECWEDIILNGIFNEVKIIKNIESDCPKKTEEVTYNLYYLLNNFKEMNSDKFKETIETVESDFEIGLYTHIGDILNIYSYLIFFSDEGIIPKSNVEIEKWVLETVDKNKDNLIGHESAGDTSYNGFGYKQSEECNKLKSKLIELSTKNYYNKLDEYINKIVDDENIKIELIIEYISELGGKNPIYYQIPILKMLPPRKIFDKLILVELKQQEIFIYALRDRYRIKYRNGVLKEVYFSEFNFIESVCKLYEELLSKEQSIYNPKFITYKYIIKQYRELIEYMRNQINGV